VQRQDEASDATLGERDGFLALDVVLAQVLRETARRWVATALLLGSRTWRLVCGRRHGWQRLLLGLPFPS
jgi:hypothetical protein